MYLKVWYHLVKYKDLFPDIRVFELGSPDIKKISKLCSGRVSLLLHPSLYKAVKVTYPMDLGSIVLDGRITTELGTWSLG